MIPTLSEATVIGSSVRESSDSASRIAGALAHELSNPVQGIRSLLRVIARESEPGSVLSQKIDRISNGVNRLADVIDIFHATYAHFPRTPDRVSAMGLSQLLETSFERQNSTVVIENEIQDLRRFQAMAPELVMLVAYTWKTRNESVMNSIAILSEDEDHAVLRIEETDRSEMIGWKGPDEIELSTGLPVLIDETARMAGGRAEFRFDDTGLRAIRIYMKFEM